MQAPIVNEALLWQLTDIARQAGAAMLPFYDLDALSVQYKEDASPLTEADLASHRLIVTALAHHFPAVPVLSEEAVVSWPERRSWQTYFLVDPLDGTKEFLHGNGEFTVNIALIHHHQAVAGVVYAPVIDACYLGAMGIGAWRIQGEAQIPLALTDANSDSGSATVPRVVASRSHPSTQLAGYLSRLGAHQLVNVGSSLKFCLLAEGKAELYPRLGATCEWDTAAGQAVLTAAGGLVRRYGCNQPLRYNTKEDLHNPWFVATAPGCSLALGILESGDNH